MAKTPTLLEDYRRKLLKALNHLEFSFQKIQRLPEDVTLLDDTSLETWESFSARFSRVADLFLAKYVRARVLQDDPGFEGSLRDFVNQGEKLGCVDDADSWMDIRELRNISAHDYTEEDLSSFFRQIKSHAPRLLALKKTIK